MVDQWMLLKDMLNSNSRRKASANLVCRWSDYPLVNKMINSYAHTREKKNPTTQKTQNQQKMSLNVPFFLYTSLLSCSGRWPYAASLRQVTQKKTWSRRQNTCVEFLVTKPASWLLFACASPTGPSGSWRWKLRCLCVTVLIKGSELTPEMNCMLDKQWKS